jgi:hypothetical protein
VEERAKIEFTLEERLRALQAALEIPKLLSTSTDKDMKQLERCTLLNGLIII